jgi:hypothetical protein
VLITVTGAAFAPEGTVTESEVAVALTTAALLCPKNTALDANVVLKFVPVMVTVVPTAPLAGEKPVMVGTCAISKKAEKRPTIVKEKDLKDRLSFNNIKIKLIYLAYQLAKMK